MSLVRRAVPPWLGSYRREDLLPDLVAGLTVAALMVPQSMAYASAAGFPAVLGLYASVVPLAVYAVAGRSGVLAIGPLISLNLVAATGIARVEPVDSAGFAAAAITLAALVGVAHVLAGVTRVSQLASRVSPVTLDGFLLAVAVVVVISQLDDLLGLIDHHLDPVETVRGVAEHVGSARWVGLTIGTATMLFLLATHRWSRLPAALVAIVLGGGATWMFGWGGDQVETLGQIPQGLPLPELPSFEHALALVPTALACTLLGVIELHALEQRFDPDHPTASSEVATVGAANLVASMFRGMPVTAVPTRTAVAAAAGARTQLTGLVAAAVTFVLLLVGTTALAYLPLPTLAAVAIVAALAYFRLPSWLELWRTDRRRFVLGITVAAVSVVVGFEAGAVAVVVLSVLDHLTTPSAASTGPG